MFSNQIKIKQIQWTRRLHWCCALFWYKIKRPHYWPSKTSTILTDLHVHTNEWQFWFRSPPPTPVVIHRSSPSSSLVCKKHKSLKCTEFVELSANLPFYRVHLILQPMPDRFACVPWMVLWMCGCDDDYSPEKKESTLFSALGRGKLIANWLPC